MKVFEVITLDPMGAFCWLSAGAVAGWMADAVMKGVSLLGDIVVGMIGALFCGAFFVLFIHGSTAFIGSILAAFFGGCILIAVARIVVPGRQLSTD